MLLGGVLTELVGWQAIFLINLPIGIALAVAARRMIPADTAPPQWRGLDLPGALLATAEPRRLVFALSQAADTGWTSAQTVILVAAGLAGLAAFAASSCAAPSRCCASSGSPTAASAAACS